MVDLNDPFVIPMSTSKSAVKASEENIDSIMAMGFTRAQAALALQKTVCAVGCTSCE